VSFGLTSVNAGVQRFVIASSMLKVSRIAPIEIRAVQFSDRSLD
jgi:hypothetical protein